MTAMQVRLKNHQISFIRENCIFILKSSTVGRKMNTYTAQVIMDIFWFGTKKYNAITFICFVKNSLFFAFAFLASGFDVPEVHYLNVYSNIWSIVSGRRAEGCRQTCCKIQEGSYILAVLEDTRNF